MAQYNSLNVKLSNSQLDKLKSAKKHTHTHTLTQKKNRRSFEIIIKYDR